VDFILKEGMKIKTLVQVCYQLSPDIEKMEIKSLIEASQELKCDELFVLTWDMEKEEKIKGKKIKFVPVWQLLKRQGVSNEIL